MEDAPARVSVLTVGDELLCGETRDTNFPVIAEEVSGLGLSVLNQQSVSDDTEIISAAIRYLSGTANVIIITGGLGPTTDDVTRESVALATGCALQMRQELAGAIRCFFESLGRPMSEENLRQAYLPEGSLEIPPAGGTAPGFMLDHDNTLIIALPGVPREMDSMLRSHVLPELEKRFTAGDVVITRRIMTFGAGESDVANMLADLTGDGDVRYGFLAMAGQVEVKLTVRSLSRREAGLILDREEAKVRNRLGLLVYGVEGETMEKVVGRLLRDQGLTVAVAESCTAGMVASRITDVPGSSDYFLGGVVCYSVDSKRKVLEIPAELLSEGTVSGPVAEAMAESVRKIFGSDIGVSVTGVAGPAGDSEKTPVGTVCIGLSHAGGIDSWEVRLPGNRDLIRNIAWLAALNVVRLHAQPPGRFPEQPSGSWIAGSNR